MKTANTPEREEKQIAIHCPTRELSDRILDMLKNIGVSVGDTDYYKTFQEETCYVIDHESNTVHYDCVDYLKSEGFDIYLAEDFLEESRFATSVCTIKDTIEEVILMLESGKPNANKHAINKLKELLK